MYFFTLLSCLNGDMEVGRLFCNFVNTCFEKRSDTLNMIKEKNILCRPETTITRSGRISRRPKKYRLIIEIFYGLYHTYCYPSCAISQGFRRYDMDHKLPTTRLVITIYVPIPFCMWHNDSLAGRYAYRRTRVVFRRGRSRGLPSDWFRRNVRRYACLLDYDATIKYRW